MLDDVLIVGAGPAGAVAATILARAGARVRLVDRAEFPRDKLCGDTVNPGALAVLRRLGMAESLDARGLRIDGMRVTGDGVAIEGRYPDGLHGRAFLRRDLDAALLQVAVEAGARFEPGVAVRRALVQDARSPVVTGVVCRGTGGGPDRTIRARVVIAADGRRSTIAFGLGLACHPRKPRRWAIGGYFEDVYGMSSLGEMHVRPGRYIGVAPLPDRIVNVCLVRPSKPADGALRNPGALLRDELARDPVLAARFADARLVSPPVVLGPLAVDRAGGSLQGLLLAGDASGFVDPMTGDGLRFAVRGGELAAAAAGSALEDGWKHVHAHLTEQRRRAFGGKWRFNRALRAIVASPSAVRIGGTVAAAAPALLRAIVVRAGDCHQA